MNYLRENGAQVVFTEAVAKIVRKKERKQKINLSVKVFGNVAASDPRQEIKVVAESTVLCPLVTVRLPQYPLAHPNTNTHTHTHSDIIYFYVNMMDFIICRSEPCCLPPCLPLSLSLRAFLLSGESGKCVHLHVIRPHVCP